MPTSCPTDPLLVFRHKNDEPHPAERLIADSLDLGWKTVYAAITQHRPLPETVRGIDHPALISLIYHISGPANLMRRIDGGIENRGLVVPRQICLTPGDVTSYWNHADYPEILRLYIPTAIYARATEEMLGYSASDAPLVPQFAIVDSMLEQLAIAIINSLRERATDVLYIDSIAHLIAVHLARTYSSRSTPARAFFPPSNVAWKIRRAIDYIEANLAKDLSLEVIADAAEISPLYLPRIFKTETGQSPHQYVIARRVERAEELLRNTDLTLSEIACLVGFSSSSHLSRWFTHQVGVRPGGYRRR